MRRAPIGRRWRALTLATVVVWLLLVGGSYWASTTLVCDTILRLAINEARTHHHKDTMYRQWATLHGGVYVPATAQTPPNPYLAHIPERDLTTPSGRRLTLVNPAYMTRQVQELGAELYGIRGHITSLNPIRPENAADPWEKAALAAFEQGVKEVHAIEALDGQPYLRLMIPFIADQGCLKCHASQGYHEGDVRGGISISLPMAPYYALRDEQQFTLISGHLLLGGVGLLTIGAGAGALRRRVREREAAYQHLEELVGERTRSLLEKSKGLEQSQLALARLLDDITKTKNELQNANAQLLELDQLKSMFIASMSHELRTPLNAIIGFSGILHSGMAGELNAEQHEMLERVQRSGRHLLNLLTDIIDIAKIESGKITPFATTFSLNEALVEAVDSLRQQAADKGLQLEIRGAEKNLDLCTDRKRLLQCLLNLISNAVKFTAHGEVLVDVLPNDGAESDRLRITVSDTGIGMSEDQLKRLFSPFVRLDSPLKNSVPGTGLGLYLTRKLTEEILGGTISARSTPGQGSAFTLDLPRQHFAQPVAPSSL